MGGLRHVHGQMFAMTSRFTIIHTKFAVGYPHLVLGTLRGLSRLCAPYDLAVLIQVMAKSPLATDTLIATPHYSHPLLDQCLATEL